MNGKESELSVQAVRGISADLISVIFGTELVLQTGTNEKSIRMRIVSRTRRVSIQMSIHSKQCHNMEKYL